MLLLEKLSPLFMGYCMRVSSDFILNFRWHRSKSMYVDVIYVAVTSRGYVYRRKGMLILCRERVKKEQQEILDYSKPDLGMSKQRINKLEYLHNCIKESLRFVSGTAQVKQAVCDLTLDDGIQFDEQ